MIIISAYTGFIFYLIAVAVSAYFVYKCIGIFCKNKNILKFLVIIFFIFYITIYILEFNPNIDYIPLFKYADYMLGYLNGFGLLLLFINFSQKIYKKGYEKFNQNK